MKRKIFTRGYDLETLKQIDNNGGQFAAAEHAFVTEKELGNTVFRSKEALFRDFLQGSWKRMPCLQFLMERVLARGYKTVVSLGAGCCAMECLLKQSLPQDTTVVATDFNAYMIAKAQQFFPEIRPVTFDFFKDEISDLEARTKLKFDLAVFFGAAYVMDDPRFIEIFRGLKQAGVQEIIDFHGGYMSLGDFLLVTLKENNLLRRVVGKRPIRKEDYKGKFHGYARSRGELRRLYKKSGLKIVREMSLGGYKYVAVLGTNE